MAPPPTNILVLGATGRVGRHVVIELVRRLCNPEHQQHRGEVVIYAATRDPNSGMSGHETRGQSMPRSSVDSTTHA